MIERLQNIENRYNELNEELMKPEVVSNVKETLKLNFIMKKENAYMML